MAYDNNNMYDNDVKFKDVFEHFDVDKDGKISSKELVDYFASVGESVNHKVAKSVVNEFLDFGEFVKLMKEEDNGELENIL
ncbi:putative EF-hand domain pair protein [Lupinus albus]|uniref:Putative EF-hand domain pair protein n=1 Tax=Lupinus albus TaxID=3870 RepID=A0A6A4NDL7_LUPAL|nr:putative EF-hand domain pair protein [Lupinus albus]